MSYTNLLRENFELNIIGLLDFWDHFDQEKDKDEYLRENIYIYNSEFSNFFPLKYYLFNNIFVQLLFSPFLFM